LRFPYASRSNEGNPLALEIEPLFQQGYWQHITMDFYLFRKPVEGGKADEGAAVFR